MLLVAPYAVFIAVVFALRWALRSGCPSTTTTSPHRMSLCRIPSSDSTTTRRCSTIPTCWRPSSRRDLPGHQRADDRGALVGARGRRSTRSTRVRTFLRVAYYVPYVTASVAVVGVWLFLFSPGGLVNQILGPLAPDPSWLVNSRPGDAGDRALRHVEADSGSSSCSTWRRCRTCPRSSTRRRPSTAPAGSRPFTNVTVPGVRPATTLVVHPRDHHRRQPVHRAVPADERRRAGRGVDLTGPRDVPEGHRTGEPDVASAIGVVLVIVVLVIALADQPVAGGRDS